MGRRYSCQRRTVQRAMWDGQCEMVQRPAWDGTTHLAQPRSHPAPQLGVVVGAATGTEGLVQCWFRAWLWHVALYPAVQCPQAGQGIAAYTSVAASQDGSMYMHATGLQQQALAGSRALGALCRGCTLPPWQVGRGSVGGPVAACSRYAVIWTGGATRGLSRGTAIPAQPWSRCPAPARRSHSDLVAVAGHPPRQDCTWPCGVLGGHHSLIAALDPTWPAKQSGKVPLTHAPGCICSCNCNN